MAKMEFILNEHNGIAKTEGKVPVLFAKETFGPGELFMASIGG